MLLGGATTYPGARELRRSAREGDRGDVAAGTERDVRPDRRFVQDMRVPTLFMTGTLDRGSPRARRPEWRRQAFELAPAGDKWLVVLEGARHASFTGRIDPTMEGSRAMDRGPMLGEPTYRRATRHRDPIRANPDAKAWPACASAERSPTSRAISLAFFDTYLRSDAEGRTALEGAGGRGGVELVKK